MESVAKVSIGAIASVCIYDVINSARRADDIQPHDILRWGTLVLVYSLVDQMPIQAGLLVSASVASMVSEVLDQKKRRREPVP